MHAYCTCMHIIYTYTYVRPTSTLYSTRYIYAYTQVYNLCTVLVCI